MTDTDIYWIWFQQVFGIASRRAHLLLNYLEHPRDIYDGICSGDNRVTDILDASELGNVRPAMEKSREILRRTIKKGCYVLTPDDALYPERLHAIYSKPAALYVKGDLSCLDNALCIAVVGPRKPSEYGVNVVKKLSCDLAENGVVVISGLANGIDTKSHWAALGAGGKTVGIMGCGIDVDYPSGSAKLKRAMCENGAVVTEYPLGSGSLPAHFPIRNRVIAGISHGTLVIEADFNSGALITARHAMEQGRNVYAVPGDIFSKTYHGVHELLKDGTKPVRHVEDILEDYPQFHVKHAKTMHIPRVSGLNIDAAEQISFNDTASKSEPEEPAAQRKPLPENLSETAKKIHEAFEGSPLTAQQLSVQLEMDIGEILASLTELEIYGVLTALPGHRFTLS